MAALYHGTTAHLRARILRRGLMTIAGIPLFLTTDEQRAQGYAARAVCVELHRRGVRDLDAARPALVVEVDVPDGVELTRDPADPTDRVIRRGIPPSWISRHYTFDARPYLEQEDIEMYAKLAARARALEGIVGERRLSA